MSRFLYPIRRLKVMPWIKYWMIKRTAGSLSEILENLTSPITLNNSLRRKFHIFEIGGNSVQDGTPTPENPIPIQNVSGSVDIKVENKNLYNDELEIGMINSQGENATNNSMSRNKGYISLQPNTEYTISLSISATVGLRYYDSNKNFISSVSSSQAPRTFTMPNNAYYLRIVIVSTDLTNKVQIGQGSTATSYVPHEEQTVTFLTQEGQVIHLGDTLEDDGVHQRRKVKVFNGTESFAYEKSGEYNRFSTPALIGVENKGNTRRDDFLCSHFTASINNGYGLCFINRTLLYFYYNAETVEEFKQWVAEQYANGTPVTVEYELAEEIIVPYTEVQQEAYNKIKALYTYKGTTHISSDNSPSPIFKIQYVKEE